MKGRQRSLTSNAVVHGQHLRGCLVISYFCQALFLTSPVLFDREWERKSHRQTLNTPAVCKGLSAILSFFSLFLCLIFLSCVSLLPLCICRSLPAVIDRCIRPTLLSVLLQLHLICLMIHYAAFRLSFISELWSKVNGK